MSNSLAGQEATGNTNSATAAAEGTNLIGQSQQTLGQFEGPVQQSPFYKALLATGQDATAGAYQGAKAATAQRANAAGYGYEQPVAQGAQAQESQAEAGAEAQLPAEAAEAAEAPAIAAANTTAGEAANENTTGANYYGTASNLAAQQAQETSSLWNSLLQIPGEAAGPISYGFTH
jgi:hypothetical protein